MTLLIASLGGKRFDRLEFFPRYQMQGADEMFDLLADNCLDFGLQSRSMH